MPLRWAFGVPLGLFGVLAGIVLEGGHPSQLLNASAAGLVLGAAVLGLLALRGPRAAWALLRAAATGVAADDADDARAATLRDLHLLERLLLLGACLCLCVGGTGALRNLDEPQRIGPALAVALSGLAVAMLANLLVVLPLKQHLVPLPATAARLPRRAATVRALRTFGAGALLATVAMAVSFRTEFGGGLVTAPSLVLVAAALVPSLFAAPAAIVAGPVSRARCAWFADALWTAGSLAVVAGVTHVFAVIDQPRMLGPGVACAFAGFALPAALAVLLRLRGAQVPQANDGGDALEPSPHLAFAGLTLTAVAAMVLFVTLVLWRLAPMG